MNGWIKYFADGTQESGSDADVHNKKASWSKGRLDNITAVAVVHGKLAAGIGGKGEFWQSDDYEADLLINRPSKLVVRRVQKRISPVDVMITARHKGDFQVATVHDLIDQGADLYIALTEDLKGKWLTVELNCNTNRVKHYFSEHRI